MAALIIYGPTHPQQIEWRQTPLKLTPRQYLLLEILADNPGRVVNFDVIYAHMYQDGEIVEPQQVHWHKTHLCLWMYTATGHKFPIKHLPRRGYCLDLRPDDIVWAREATNVRQNRSNNR